MRRNKTRPAPAGVRESLENRQREVFAAPPRGRTNTCRRDRPRGQCDQGGRASRCRKFASPERACAYRERRGMGLGNVDQGCYDGVRGGVAAIRMSRKGETRRPDQAKCGRDRFPRTGDTPGARLKIGFSRLQPAGWGRTGCQRRSVPQFWRLIAMQIEYLLAVSMASRRPAPWCGQHPVAARDHTFGRLPVRENSVLSTDRFVPRTRSSSRASSGAWRDPPSWRRGRWPKACAAYERTCSAHRDSGTPSTATPRAGIFTRRAPTARPKARC